MRPAVLVAALLVLASGCYTVLRHPAVLPEAGPVEAPLVGDARIHLADDCAACHSEEELWLFADVLVRGWTPIADPWWPWYRDPWWWDWVAEPPGRPAGTRSQQGEGLANERPGPGGSGAGALDPLPLVVPAGVYLPPAPLPAAPVPDASATDPGPKSQPRGGESATTPRSGSASTPSPPVPPTAPPAERTADESPGSTTPSASPPRAAAPAPAPPVTKPPAAKPPASKPEQGRGQANDRPRPKP